MYKAKQMTVYEVVTKGKRMNEARDKIRQILDDAEISIIDRYLVLDLMAAEIRQELI